MAKKHELTEQQYAMYRKHHPYDDIVGTEEEKIDRETTCYAHHRWKGNRQVKENLRKLMNQGLGKDNEVEDPFELSDEDEYIAERVLRNARTHKRRLAGLRNREIDS